MTEEELLNRKNPIGAYGEIFSIENTINISTILSDPEKHLNQQVLISGEVVDVCPMRGCWIDVKELNSDKIIKVKVKDGNIVFPISANHHSIEVKGILTKIIYTKDQAINWKIHLAEEKGIELDKNSISISEVDLIEYRINGIGAKIY